MRLRMCSKHVETSARILALSLAVLGIACGEHGLQKKSAPPNILLVVLDTVRADRTSAYGYSRPTTPQLEHLGKIGIVFEDVTAPASWTPPSHASLFTGQPPWVHGVHLLPLGDSAATRGDASAIGRMREDLPTLATQLADAGYRTIALSANAWLKAELGITRGFETNRTFDTDSEVLKAAKEEIRNQDARPVFMFVNLMTAHSPYIDGPKPWNLRDASLLDPETAPEWVRPYLTVDPPGVDMNIIPEPSWGTGWLRYAGGKLMIPDEGVAMLNALYDAGVAGSDFFMRHIVSEWGKRFPDGIVIATSDHGEALTEHGMLGHRAVVYSEVTRVPLVIAAPRYLPQGIRVATPVQLQDLYPTVLQLAGIEDGEGSLIPIALQGKPRPGPIVAVAWPEPYLAKVRESLRSVSRLIREGSIALIWTGDDLLEFYDLSVDPAMRTNLAKTRPEDVEKLRRVAHAYFERFPEVIQEPMIVDETTKEQLRNLGYMAE